ncbi:MAG: hypothetical protein R3C60_02490 [Parvularculaceae bacterium]
MLQCGDRFGVALDIPGDLIAPIGGVGFRLSPPARAVMAVPKTSVHEYNGAIARQDDVRRAGQIARVRPVTKAFRVQRFSKRDFRLGVARLDGAHDLRALFRREYVAALLFSFFL